MIRYLNIKDADNESLLKSLVDNINKNYSITEEEFWKDGVVRTNTNEFKNEIIKKNVIAYFEGEQVLGSLNFEVNGDRAVFTMLSVNLDQHGRGIGNQLFSFLLNELDKVKVKFLNLHLLVPRNYVSGNKKWISNWYQKNGFEIINKERAEDLDFFPHQNLKIKSDFLTMIKKL